MIRSIRFGRQNIKNVLYNITPQIMTTSDKREEHNTYCIIFQRPLIIICCKNLIYTVWRNIIMYDLLMYRVSYINLRHFTRHYSYGNVSKSVCATCTTLPDTFVTPPLKKTNEEPSERLGTPSNPSCFEGENGKLFVG